MTLSELAFLYISYYRLVAKLLAYSTVVVNNYVLEIPSHLVGFLVFLMIAIYDSIVIIPSFNGTIRDQVIFAIFLLCFQFCMLNSAGYHLFCCRSELACKRWFSLDLAGISVGLLGCYFPAVFYAFSCFPVWRDVYLVVVCCMILVTLVLQLHPLFLTSYWSSKRLIALCAVVAFGIIPASHWVVLQGGFDSLIVQIFGPKVIIMYILGVLALFFYATKFPERCFPGRVDYVGSSHQLWHMVVVFAFLWWHQTGVTLMEFRDKHPCEEQLPGA
ncbi:progestin and adipoQ receptor family member 3-like [Anneissia japonica]|uniref:progestin and adipoQ receptor family member 3-like n=1 Tax=Anneissia japonica TaxID=1529436 RepID=UPI0014254FF9|nr:progestin and adipoQ receptor family member 3-like [Anneissia japonica]